MQKHFLALTAGAFLVACGATAASAQGPMMGQPAQPQTQTAPGTGQGYDGGWGYGRWHHMMRGGFTGGQGMIGNPIMMRIMFALMDTDGDGTIELPEFQAAHERIFKAMDTNKDGHLTLEELETFMHGTSTAAPTPAR